MPTLVVGMFRRYLAIHMPTTSVGMPPDFSQQKRMIRLETNCHSPEGHCAWPVTEGTNPRVTVTTTTSVPQMSNRAS